MRVDPTPTSLGELAARIGAELHGDPDRHIAQVGTLRGAGAQAISFLANARYRSALERTRAAAVILQEKHLQACPVDALVTPDPYVAYAQIATLLYPRVRPPASVHRSAVVADDAVLGEGVVIGANAVIEDGAHIADGSIIGPGSVIGPRSTLGRDCRLGANVTLCDRVIVGDRVLLHPGVVLGADGFGLAPTSEGWLAVPQVGRVRVGDDVEIGASTTVDRGAIDDTVIGNGVRLDNLIQIAHNVHIGDHTVIAACTGISGSTRIGQRCIIGGAACIGGHLEVGDDVTITGMAMVHKSLKGPGMYSSGLPAEENREWRRGVGRYRKLGKLVERVAALEAQLPSAGNPETSQED
ncbi:MAG: UDP-3-O-(3-hydroxymyristoyl)glucosamine N-acyltransferase [Pseudomonadota bacterium]